MAGRMYGVQHELVGGEPIAVCHDRVGNEPVVLIFARRRRPPDSRRAGQFRQGLRGRRMIWMRMRHEDPANRPRRALLDRFDVRIDERPGIQYRDFVLTQQVSIRARPGHRAGIRRDQAPDSGSQRRYQTGCELCAQSGSPGQAGLLAQPVTT